MQQQDTIKHKSEPPEDKTRDLKAPDKKGYKLTKLGWIPEEWEVSAVKDFGTVITGSTPKTNNSEFYQGDLPFVSPTDLNGTKYIIETEKRLSKAGFETGRKIKKGSVLFVSIGSTIGKTAIAGRELITNQQINSVVPSKTNSGEFIFYQLSFHSERFKKIAGNQAVPILNKSTFQDIEIVRPPLPEQKKIAEILSTWDKAIAKTEQLIAQKQQHKKALMQQLLTGKWRFKHDSKRLSDRQDNSGTSSELMPSGWKTYRFGELFEFLPTNSYSRDQLEYSEDGTATYNIHYGDIHSTFNEPILDFRKNYKNVPVLKENRDVGPHYLLRDGDLIIADVSEDYEGVGECIVIKGVDDKKILSGLHTFAVRDRADKTLLGFRPYLFKHPKVANELKKIATGSKVFGISKKNISSIELIVPPLPEQQKIASVLSAADQEIAVLQSELEKLKEQKKGLMQKLLTGEVRVSAQDLRD